MLPFFPGDYFMQMFGLLFVAGGFSVVEGLRQDALLCRILWAGLAELSLCVLLTSIVLFFIYFFDTPPNRIVSLFTFQTRGITDALIPFIILLAFNRSQAAARDEDERKNFDERLALMRAQYKLFMEGDEIAIAPVDPTQFGYGNIIDDVCYFGMRDVTLGKFVEWTREVTREIAGKLKIAVAEGSVKLGRKPAAS
jgi:hypothetical protein